MKTSSKYRKIRIIEVRISESLLYFILYKVKLRSQRHEQFFIFSHIKKAEVFYNGYRFLNRVEIILITVDDQINILSARSDSLECEMPVSKKMHRLCNVISSKILILLSSNFLQESSMG